ncbi:hypothetical protein P43SY_003328 [Pythium insidiosum]|uniref:C3HC-type domain-containing protein n=1 Tax=Pythium insidiosum TaxID=114742 RepID=A0AAD5LFW5_PYTIN|nr:hypothetical protein P43SY_003328 [Pythium insidiosum]
MEDESIASTDTITIERALKRWRDVTAPLDHDSVDHDAAVIASPSRFPAVRAPRDKCGTSTSAGCRAWSHSEFLARVASFAISTWFAKPLVLSPLACARHGWRNVGPEMLHCSSCEQFLCCFIDDSLGDDGVTRVADAFARELATGHASDCPWRENPSPESFVVLPVLSPPQVLETLVRRVQVFVDAVEKDERLQSLFERLSIASTTRSKVASDDAKEQRFRALLATRLSKGDSVSADVLWNVALVSIAGWKLGSQGDVELHCELCNRHVPLAVGDRDAHAFDPVAQHRWFCPWVNAQRRTEDTATQLRELINLLPDQRADGDATSIEEFIRLPGWRQNALALEHLSTQANDPKQQQQQQQAVGSTEDAAAQALSTVQAILGLTEYPL